MRLLRTACALLAATGLSVLSGASRAEAPPAVPPTAEQQGTEAGPIRLEMKEVEIRGEVERPEVFYIIPRKEARMELGPLSKDFRDEIMEPLLPGPFEEQAKGRKR